MVMRSMPARRATSATRPPHASRRAPTYARSTSSTARCFATRSGTLRSTVAAGVLGAGGGAGSGVGKRAHARELIAQLTHVARPVVRLQHRDRLRRQVRARIDAE